MCTRTLVNTLANPLSCSREGCFDCRTFSGVSARVKGKDVYDNKYGKTFGALSFLSYVFTDLHMR